MRLGTTLEETGPSVGKSGVRTSGSGHWPAEVDFILSAMDAGAVSPEADRRTRVRLAYHVKASLRLFSDDVQAPPRVLYTRDADARGIGFISPTRLPLSYGGVVELLAPNGDLLAVQCTLIRCREVSTGWFEGALYFNREQWPFARVKGEGRLKDASNARQ